MSAVTVTNHSAERISEQIGLILHAWGMDPDAVAVTAKVMTQTDLWGIDSHGLSMLMRYEELYRKGILNVRAKARVVRENAVTALIDADAGIGHPVSVMGMQKAIEKARAAGIGAVGVFNSHHFGAAGYYSRLAAESGLVGFSTTSVHGMHMVPTGGSVPLLGTNPIAFAAPAKKHRPFSLDMATTTVAMGKIKVNSLNGWPLPEGWFVNGRGRPVRDATIALTKAEGGGLTPIGGTSEMRSHKGYGLAVMVDILAGALTGGTFAPLHKQQHGGADAPHNVGHFFLAIDPQAFRPLDAFEQDVDAIIDVLHATPPADAENPVLVAGEPEDVCAEQRLREGIPVPSTLAVQIEEICDRAGAPFVLRT